MHFLRGYW